MEIDVYLRLAKFLDNLPGGFPSTESGVELRILKRLFTPDEAELALSLTLISEEPRVIARRAGIPVDEAVFRLDEMEKKGLIFGTHSPGNLHQYSATNFVVGIWEFQVKRLNPELVCDFEEYMPHLFKADIWQKVPQIRTVPISQAIDAEIEVMSYENAEALVQSHDNFSVAPCICRSEKRMMDQGCDKPLETCLSFGSAADFYIRNGIGRKISKEEALNILNLANSAGLVLSPGNSQDASFICACCGCCCGILRSVKTCAKPASIVSSPFFAEIDLENCLGCGACVDRCQMEALRLDHGKIILDLDRCIGCGLCVTTCPTHSINLHRKSISEQHVVPKNIVEITIKLGKLRSKLSNIKMMGMLLQSKIDRIIAPR